ncbi:MAG: ATP-dependent ligase [Verrucomicrobiaceae bacterium]|nr:ATP-dependent ligase [Verrucomicrobiaceae bacterium]
MQRFAQLYQRLERSTAANDKLAALMAYLNTAEDNDMAWAIWLLNGGKLSTAKNKLATTRELREWIATESHIPLWLVEECYEQVGDLAETVTLLFDEPTRKYADRSLTEWIENILLPSANRDESARREVIVAAWRELDFSQRFVFNKFLLGNLRVGVSRGVLQKALASIFDLDVSIIAQRMLGAWEPTSAFVATLRDESSTGMETSAAYPFYLASPIGKNIETLGPISDWLLEWKWDGIRLQLILREQQTVLWSRGEERMDERFPEIENSAAMLPVDCVIDGELLAWGDGDNPHPFSVLQTRIQRRKPGAKTLSTAPVHMLAYDLLELNGEDLRQQPLSIRRERLIELLASCNPPAIQISPEVVAASWQQATELRTQSRERGVEGLMVKRRSSFYLHGRKRGDWWKWKVDPLTIDAVLIYAQSGSGRRSTLFTDYTFGVWDNEQLVPIAKAYSGLTDDEILQLDRWIRANTTERFGPVRAVNVEHVFELAFEGVNKSSRHKSGIAVRFPRILRWRHDKNAAQADHLKTLAALAR